MGTTFHVFNDYIYEWFKEARRGYGLQNRSDSNPFENFDSANILKFGDDGDGNEWQETRVHSKIYKLNINVRAR